MSCGNKLIASSDALEKDVPPAPRRVNRIETPKVVLTLGTSKAQVSRITIVPPKEGINTVGQRVVNCSCRFLTAAVVYNRDK